MSEMKLAKNEVRKSVKLILKGLKDVDKASQSTRVTETLLEVRNFIKNANFKI